MRYREVERAVRRLAHARGITIRVRPGHRGCWVVLPSRTRVWRPLSRNGRRVRLTVITVRRRLRQGAR